MNGTPAKSGMIPIRINRQYLKPTPNNVSLGVVARLYCGEDDFNAQTAITNAGDYTLGDESHLTKFVEVCREFLAYLGLTKYGKELKANNEAGAARITKSICRARHQLVENLKTFDGKPVRLLRTPSLIFMQKTESDGKPYIYVTNRHAETIKMTQSMTLEDIISKSLLVKNSLPPPKEKEPILVLDAEKEGKHMDFKIPYSLNFSNRLNNRAIGEGLPPIKDDSYSPLHTPSEKK